MMEPITRLVGPKTHVCWTPDHTPVRERIEVSLVRESELQELERFFVLPLHQQIQQMQKTVNRYMSENKGTYPQGTFLIGLSKSLDLAHGLAFAHFCTNLAVTEVHS